MQIKIATWNLCLGLFHKKDYVRSLLNENQIDVLNLQETEIAKDIDLTNLQIKGYALEMETNENKRRVATYIKNTIPYKRRDDLETPNMHLLIVDLQTRPALRVITIYRTFSPQETITSREHFRRQLKIINDTTTTSTILLGDFNLDENKRYVIDYSQRLLFQDFNELIGHHHYTQHVTEPTWNRVINNELKSSVIDHIYCTNSTNVESLTYKDTMYGDHKLVMLCTQDNVQEKEKIMLRRNWRNYSEKSLLNELSKVRWQTSIESVQEMWNSYENEIIRIVDELAPTKEVVNIINRSNKSPILKSKINRRRYLLKKRKNPMWTGDEERELKTINKHIRNLYYKDRRQHVRRKIIPGNNKSLWDAVKIAKDLEPTPLPSTVVMGGIGYSGKEIASAFSEHFISKIEGLKSDTRINSGVYNGRKIINSEEINFMTADKVHVCLKELKIKIARVLTEFH